MATTTTTRTRMRLHVAMNEDAKRDALKARPYQEELLRKAIEKNIVVYLGTGAGKTYVSVMLIKQMRGELGRMVDGKVRGGKKAIFLVSSVPLVDQQKDQIENSTGLEVGSYSGADGVDDWDEARWRIEFEKYQVMVFVHEVFRLMCCGRKLMTFSDIALLIIDECHHAVKKHPYSEIMLHYHESKARGLTMPKVLGLTACVVISSTSLEKFRQQKAELEQKLDCTVETVENLADILEYVTNPTEEFKYYSETSEIADTVQIIRDKLTSAVRTIGDIMEGELGKINNRFAAAGRFSQSQQLAKNDLLKDYKELKNNVFQAIDTCLTELGINFVISQISSFIESVRRSFGKGSNLYYSNETRNKLFENSLTHLNDIRRLVEKKASEFEGTELERILAFSSKKFLTLLELFEEEKDKAGDMMCITFVKTKTEAIFLSNLIQRVARLDPRFCHIKCDYLHSTNSSLNVFVPTDRDIIFSERRRIREVLKQFRKGELNVICSTSVVEEGLDVRKCNLIVRYFFPETFRNYVQSKGRARAKPSKFVMLAPREEAVKYEMKYRQYCQVEKMSVSEIHNQRSEEGIEDGRGDDEDRETFTSNPDDPMAGAVNGSQAISLVYQYINKIPRDRFTRLIPVWQLEKVVGSIQDQLFAGLGVSNKCGYSVTCQMPHKTPFIEPVVGPLRKNKDSAKRACALEIISQLYQYKELDYKLRVKPKFLIDPEDEDDEDEEEGVDGRGLRMGTRRRRQFYRQRLPKALDQPLGEATVAALFAIRMVLVEPVPNNRYLHYFPEKDPTCLGLVMGTRTPDVGPFSLFGPSGKLEVTINFVKNISVDQKFLDCAEEFHKFSFLEVLRIPQELVQFKQNSSCLLVPLKDREVDFSLLRKETRPYMIGEQNRVVFPSYKSQPNHYFVEEIRSDFSPRSVMDKVGETTYLSYYRDKYRITIQDHSQPLLRISFADKNYFMYKSGSAATGDSISDNIANRTLLIPELMNVARVEAGLWRQIQVVPFCLQRMTSLLHAHSLLSNLSDGKYATETSLELPGVLGVGAARRDNLLHHLLQFSSQSSTPLKVSHLLEALTLRNTDDGFDLERLEVLGDVFLKLRTSIFIYYSVQDSQQNKTNICEGELTQYRSRVVGNKNLFLVAEGLGLGEGPVNSAKLDPQGNWLPPGFVSTVDKELIDLDREFPSHLSTEARKRTVGVGSLLNYVTQSDIIRLKEDKRELLPLAVKRIQEQQCVRVQTREFRLVANKSLADAVEALIGCFLVGTGQKETLSMMARIGIDLSPANTKEDLLERKVNSGHDIVEFPPEEDAFGNSFIRQQHQGVAALYNRLGVSDLEAKIGYTFKEKSFLLQAFTHSSYSENRVTDSYERLEYLGDAVLDYVVSCYIASHGPQETDPGRFTETRSALVCNNMFASQLVAANLHGHILYSAPLIQTRIADYVENTRGQSSDYLIRNGGVTRMAEENLRLINESEPPQLEEVEVPKVLGDVFEAVIGAIYIDSGHNLQTVWQVYRRLQPNLETLVHQPPSNPKKDLHQLFPGNVKFGKAEVFRGGDTGRAATVKVVVSVGEREHLRKFAGLGVNRKMAELGAVKCALKRLRKQTRAYS